MSETKKLIPKRRFKEFQDAGEWELSKLSELTYVYDGTHQTPSYTDKGIMFLSVENIKSMKSNKFISVEDFKEEFKVFPEKGDVLMTRIGDIGTANVYDSDEPVAYYVSLALLKRKELDPYYLKEVIACDTVQKELWHRTLHIAFPKKINKNEIEKVIVPYPKEKLEQEKIGKHFEELDNLITLQQHKLEKIKSMKKAYLYEMFPAEGESKPKRRFKEFTDDWELCELSDETNSIDTGRSKFISKNDGKYKILGSTSVIGYDDNYDYEGDFLLTARVGANAGEVYRHSGKVKISDNTVFIQGENLDFTYYMLMNFDIKKLAFGTGQPLVKASELKQLRLMFPMSEEEKIKIGIFFKNIDNLITLHQSKLDKLKNLKKAYLNEMFI